VGLSQLDDCRGKAVHTVRDAWVANNCASLPRVPPSSTDGGRWELGKAQKREVPMDDEAEIGAFEEVVDALLEARWEIRALRQLLIDRKVFSEEEITAEIENIKNEEYVNLKKRVLRQAFERSLKKRLTQ